MPSRKNTMMSSATCTSPQNAGVAVRGSGEVRREVICGGRRIVEVEKKCKQSIAFVLIIRCVPAVRFRVLTWTGCRIIASIAESDSRQRSCTLQPTAGFVNFITSVLKTAQSRAATHHHQTLRFRAMRRVRCERLESSLEGTLQRFLEAMFESVET